MPTLDVSEILEDDDIADQFDVKRRAETIDETSGRSVLKEHIFNAIVGVVVASSPGKNSRRDDSQMTSREINVVTRFRLRASGAGFQPDQIFWYGSWYTVKSVVPHGRFGNGFVKATAESMNAADAAPV